MLEQITPSDLWAWFKDSSIAREIISEREAAREEQRTAAREEIKRLERELAEKLPALARAREVAQAKRAKALEAFKIAERALGAAHAEAVAAEASYAGQIAAHGKLLWSLCDSEKIDTFRRELEALHRDCDSLIVCNSSGVYNAVTGYEERVATGNYEQVEARARHLLRLIQQVQEWKFRGLAGPELDAAIAAARAAIPDASPTFSPVGKNR